jgi:transposase
VEPGQALDHQPRPGLRAKKKRRDRLIELAARHPDWVVGFQDECWWSRLALPAMHAWAGEGDPLRLVERAVPKEDADPKALSCYGLWRADTEAMMLRFVAGRPVSQVTEDYLAWVCERLRAEGKKALLLVWDNAAWHASKRVRAWIRAHNRKAKSEGGVRIVACFLPVKSPWLNPIEPRWAHGKKAIVEPDRLLSAEEVRERVRLYYDCDPETPLVQQTEKKVA